ncbi:MAG: hypothetical protein CSB33_02975 [Desulfobacterales bacterium]|nr:MAG: hypothetical protein CSB33_02975 [Desulfobacterales bacterium]
MAGRDIRSHPPEGRRRGRNRGMALLLTLAIMTVLITVSLELNRRTRDAVTNSAMSRDRITLSEMAGAGVQAAMALLIRDKNTSSLDSIQEDWADPAKINELLGDIPFDQGTVSLSITDELGKIQVNALVDFPKGRHFNDNQKIMWDRFLRLVLESVKEKAGELDLEPDLENVEAPAIINCIKDWLDSGDDGATTGLSGAESEYYEGLDPPCSPANGPFTHLEELMLVKNIPAGLFGGIGESGGIADYLTVHGMKKADTTVDNRNYTFEGRININTADLPVLTALIPSGEYSYAAAIFNYRNEKEDGEYIHDLSQRTWYKNAPDIPEDLVIDDTLITLVSDVFRIRSTAKLNGRERTVETVVRREQAPKTGKWMCNVISWQVR